MLRVSGVTMDRMTRRQALLVMGGLAVVAGAHAQDQVPQALLDARLKDGGVALAAGVLAGGRSDFAGASVRGPRPDADSRFEIGSITKTFTALLLAEAVVRGELKLDDAVEAVLPDGLKLRDSAREPLRWLDLATHRSGMPRLATNIAPARLDDPYADYNWASLHLFLKGWQPTVARGSRYEYSNLGFGLLGHALALSQRTNHASLLTRRVLQPLGLERHISFDDMGLLPGHDAEGKPVPAWHFQSTTAGAGALRGSARGLLRYAEAALGRYEHPLREAFALCLQRHGAGPSPANPVGLAWLIATLNGRTEFNHDGATAGSRSSLWLDPERSREAVVLSNAQVPVDDLALHLVDESVPPRDMSATRQASIILAAEQLKPLAGIYALNPQFKLTVRADGQRLYAQATGQGEFELFANAKAPRRFFAKVTPLEVEFDADGKAITLLQGGSHLRFVRD
jgi:serine-type D-Ala-D-Ala carboxypeptidase/endopeptidase